MSRKQTGEDLRRTVSIPRLAVIMVPAILLFLPVCAYACVPEIGHGHELKLLGVPKIAIDMQFYS